MESKKVKTVGLIGIGLLGSAIAHRLIRAGFSVWGHDVSPQAMSAFSVKGGQPILKIGDVPIAANPVIFCLPDSDAVENVLVSIIPRLKPGTILIDTTTGDPDRTRATAERIADAGIMLMDASVLGSSTVTRDGNALLMVGASPLVMKESRSVLEAVSTHIHHVGPVGAGQEMKLIANLVLGLNRAALAEGLHFAKNFSVNQHTVLEVLKAGVTYSRVMDSKGQRMIEEDFTPQARLSQHLKDVNLMLQHAANGNTALPLSETHRMLLQTAEDAGNGELDNSAVIRAWSQLSAAQNSATQ